jgi:hypothetical protein
MSNLSNQKRHRKTSQTILEIILTSLNFAREKNSIYLSNIKELLSMIYTFSLWSLNTKNTHYIHNVLVQCFEWSTRACCVNQYYYESRHTIQFIHIWHFTYSSTTLQCRYIIIRQRFFWRNVDRTVAKNVETMFLEMLIWPWFRDK